MTAALPVLVTSSDAWDWYWRGWIAMLAVTFLPPELYAASTHNSHTLSESMWRWQHMYWAAPFDLQHWTILHYFLAAFLLWLFLHISLGLVR